MDIWIAGMLFGAGLFAGALNAAAGGATFFTFPALMMAGLPPLVANASNYVALIPSNLTALPAYKAELQGLGRELIRPIIACALGGLLGALLLLYCGSTSFEKAVPYLMGVATAMFAGAPYLGRYIRKKNINPDLRQSNAAMFLIFLACIYGGYFGAGLGPIVLAALIVIGYENLFVANALKNAMMVALSTLSTGVYVMSGTVSWPEALIMMAGAALGGYGGGILSKFVSQDILRKAIIVFGVLLTAFYFLT